MKKLFAVLAITALALTNQSFAQQNIVDTAASAGNFSTLLTAAKAAGLAETLATGNFTVFAPNDDAFSKIAPDAIANLLKPENREQLAAILTYHVVPGTVRAADAYSLENTSTVNGQRLALDIDGDLPTIGDANLIKTDIECTNGVIHVIDSVLMPASDSIPTVATNAGTFNTLLTAATEAGLAETLGSVGPFTVFAPSDDAFNKLPAGTVEDLLKPENRSKLVNILKYHVVSGRAYDSDAVKARSVSTLQGQSVNVSVSEKGVRINDANVIARNIEASNGVIHVIDAVLLPTEGMPPAQAVSMLIGAIDQGVPVFNSGHHSQCCEIYTNALQTLSDSGINGCPAATMTMVRNTLTNARSTSHATQRAWMLRHCIDSVVAQMRSMPMVSMR